MFSHFAIILLSYMDSERSGWMNVAVDAINAINPGSAPDASGEVRTGDSTQFIRDNAEFEKQSQMGRATGYLRSSPELREAITEFYENQHQQEEKRKSMTTIVPDDVLG